jgi:hypothetical protein
LERSRRVQEDARALAAAEFQEEELVDPIDPIDPPLGLNPNPMLVDPMPQLPNQDVGAMDLLQLKASAKLAYDLESLEDNYATALLSMQFIICNCKNCSRDIAIHPKSQ